MKVTQPIVKNKKEEKEEKYVVGLAKTLINNTACIRCAVSPRYKWWLSPIIAIVSVAITTIPSIVSASTAKGYYILKENKYSLDLGMETFTETLNGLKIVDGAKTFDNTQEINVTIQEDSYQNHILDFATADDQDKWNANVSTYVSSEGKTYHYFEYNKANGYVDAENNPVEVTRLRVFFAFDTENGENKAYALADNESIFGVNSTLTSDDADFKSISSILIFGTNNFYLLSYGNAEARSKYLSTPYKGDYKGIATGTNLKNLLTSKSTDEVDGDRCSLLDSKWMKFFDKGYSTQRDFNTLVSFAITGILNASMFIIFGLLIFIITRGKNNANRVLHIGHTYQITAYASVTPALITLIVGFILPKFATYIFVICCAVRLMSLTTKQLGPGAPAVK